ncbi:MAG: hypothetical protein Q9186_004101 [Xanthomendoza sp. 1 TL-2023]
MFVYIDGEYQCNRGRSNLKVPTSTTQKHHTDIDFVVRQKEEPLPGSSFLGRQWTFGGLEGVSETNFVSRHSGSLPTRNEHMGVIEVVVLRSLELQRPKAPDPSTSELHPIAFSYSTGSLSSHSTGSSRPLEDADMSDFEGIFDGASDSKRRRTVKMSFGGDMAWDDDEKQYPGPHINTDWSGGAAQNRTASNHGRGKSQALSQSPPAPAATPAIQIFVNQPAANTPAPGSAEGTQRWNRPTGSVASWGPAASVHAHQAGPDQDAQSDNGWQTWIMGAEQQPPGPPRSNQNEPRPGNHHNGPQQSSSSSSGGSKNMNDNGNGSGNDNDNSWDNWEGGSREKQAQNVPGAWDAATEKQGHTSNHGRNNQGGESSDWKTSNGATHENSGWNNDMNHVSGGQNNDGGWGNNETSNNQPDRGWDNGNNRGDDRGNRDTNGGGNKPNDDWGGGIGNNNNVGNGDWKSGQNKGSNQGGFDNSGDQNEGRWKADQAKGQSNSGWNGAGHNHGNGGQDHSNRNATHGNSGRPWENANTGATEPQTSSNPDRNTFTSNQNGWNQEGVVNDSFPATTGGPDPAKTRSRRASSGKVKSVRSNMSQQASMNHAVQKTGRKPSNSVNGSGGGPVHSGPQQSGPPGAWPENSHNVPNVGIRPYHVVLDAVGNPTLPTMQHNPPKVEAPAPAPAPLPIPATIPIRIERGQPALYQHKTASPRYIDTHDKPYASFIFKYGPKVVVEQMLNLVIPDSAQFEKAKLVHLSKEELIEEVIKTKSQLGSKASSAVSSLGSVPPSVNNPANGGNVGWGVNQHGGAANQQSGNTDWYGGNGGHHGTGNAGIGPSGGAFATTLNDKLAALADQNTDSSSSNSGSNNISQAWNDPPPGSPLANNGNANFGGRSKGHAPTPAVWGAQNNSNWNGRPATGPSNGRGGNQVEAWIGQTLAGGSVGGHQPWVGNSGIKNSGASVGGGNAGNNAGNWGGSQGNRGNDAGKGSKVGNKADGVPSGWGGSQTNNNGNNGWNGGSQNNGAAGNGEWKEGQSNFGGNQRTRSKSQHSGTRNDNSAQGGWNGNGNTGGSQGGGWSGESGNGGKHISNGNASNGNGNGDSGGGWNNNGNGNGNGDTGWNGDNHNQGGRINDNSWW